MRLNERRILLEVVVRNKSQRHSWFQSMVQGIDAFGANVWMSSGPGHGQALPRQAFTGLPGGRAALQMVHNWQGWLASCRQGIHESPD